jgi:hypothetical protein
MKIGEIQEKVNKLTTINFSITKCPIKVYEAFTQFCKEETNDNYSFGLKILIEGIKTNAKEATLFQQYLELKDEVAELKQLIAQSGDKPKSKKIKTMGSGGDE